MAVTPEVCISRFAVSACPLVRCPIGLALSLSETPPKRSLRGDGDGERVLLMKIERVDLIQRQSAKDRGS